MFILINKIKKIHEDYRKRKIPVKNRKKTYVIIIDSVKAFDNMRRQILIKDLIEMGVEPTLIKATKALLTDTYMELNGEKIQTEKGGP
jgi:hypothetical protein